MGGEGDKPPDFRAGGTIAREMNEGGGYLLGNPMREPRPAALPELLAPAGSMEALRAAVSCGADAVYLGGKRFSARQYAGNFDDRELARAVEFAHGRGVRVYVAVNTLLHDREIPEAAEYLLFLAETGVDAVLVQDPGLAALAREVVPSLPLHASTQMTIHNTAGLEWAASLGLSRVVLARELSLGRVEAMGSRAEELGIGLEIFAHGALCYSYSGQCLLSSAIGGRSGNRGRCAQPCRRPYALVRGEADEYGRPRFASPVPLSDRYLLSTKDLSLYPYLDRVARAPVAALKIEGRMRSPGYVATVTGIYRRALDAIAAGSRVPQEPGSSRGEEARSSPGSEGTGAVPGVGPLGTGSSCPGGAGGPSGAGSWAPSPADEEALALAFSRGFTGGCLCEGPEEIMGRDAPDHRGILVGIVDHVDPASGSVGVRLAGSSVPARGDGLVFRARGREARETGMVLRQEPAIDAGILWMKAERGALPGITRGAGVSITRRARQAGVPCFSPGTTAPRWPRIMVDLVLRVAAGGRPVLEGTVTRKGVEVMVGRREAGFTAEPARARALTGDEVKEVLSKRGDAPYSIGEVRVEWPAGSYARKGDLGELRRELLAEVERSLSTSGRPDPGEISRARERLGRALAEPPSRDTPRGKPSLVLLTDSADGLEHIVEEGSGLLACEPAPRGGIPEDRTPFEEAWLAVRDSGWPEDTTWSLVWKWPRITGDSWPSGLPMVADSPDLKWLNGIMVEGAGAALAVKTAIPGFTVHGGPGLNAWNARTLRVLSPLLSSITLSPELSLQDLRELVAGTWAPGNLPSLGFFVEGNLEVMTSEDRLTGLLPERRGRSRGPQFTGIEDTTSRIFPVTTDICGRTRVANSVETCLMDQLPALASLGIRHLLIDARGRGPRYAREMAALYGEALSVMEAGGDGVSRRLEELREECRMRARGGITRGAFLRGLREEDG
jgi:putative protease